MKNIAIISSTRAEYGLLQPFIMEFRKHESNNLMVSLIVTGTHLSKEYGMTISEIETAGIRVDEKIPIRLKSETANDIAKNQADIVIKFTDLFSEKEYDAICILGDRYEMQMIAIAATNTGTPIFHLCGGDITEGAVDDSIRHSITKMSYCHFPTNELSRKRVIQLGEDPSRVFNVGSTSIDNILNMELMPVEKALESIGLSKCKYAIATYHPVTLENQDIETDVMAFIGALTSYPNINFIVTKANADKGGSLINELLGREALKYENIHVFTSLGVKRYLSLMKHAEFVLGNSSSGIIEAPAFHIPTVNIGDRQKGRLQSESIINCGTSKEEITRGIKKAQTDEFKQVASTVISPYGNGNAAKQMVKICISTVKEPMNLKKKFFDL